MAGSRTPREGSPGGDSASHAEHGRLLPWSWAEERLAGAESYRIVTLSRRHGHPATATVRGVWYEGSLWFTIGKDTPACLDLLVNPQMSASLGTDPQTVIVDGSVEPVVLTAHLSMHAYLLGQKYEVGYRAVEVDPEYATTFRLWPRSAFGARPDRCSTRWTFSESS